MPVVPAEGFVYNGLNREVVDGATATGVCVCVCRNLVLQKVDAT